MADSLRRLFISWCRGVVELLVFFPVLVLLTPLDGIADAFPFWLLALTLFMPLGALGRLLVRSELRLLHVIIGAIVVVGLAWLLFGNQYTSWSAILLGGVLYYHGFGTVRAGWYVRFPVGVLWIGLFLYLLGGLILPRIEMYASYSSLLGWLGVVAVVVTFFISNQVNLEEETHSGDKEVRLSRGVITKNRVLILVVLAIIIVIGMIGPIMSAIIWLKELLLSSIRALFAFMDREPSAPPVETTTPSLIGQGEMELPTGEPSAFAEFMDKALYYVAVSLTVVVALVAVYFLSRLIYRAVKAIIQRLMARNDEAELGVQAYEEEKTSLLDWKEIRKQYGDRLTSLFKRERDPSWESLDASGRVRLLYRLFVRKNVNAGQVFDPHLTPQELLSRSKEGLMSKEEREQLANAYNSVRYGNKSVDEELSDRLKRSGGL